MSVNQPVSGGGTGKPRSVVSYDINYTIDLTGRLAADHNSTAAGHLLTVRSDNPVYAGICARLSNSGSDCDCTRLAGVPAGSHLPAGSGTPVGYRIQAGAGGVYDIVVLYADWTRVLGPQTGTLNVGS